MKLFDVTNKYTHKLVLNNDVITMHYTALFKFCGFYLNDNLTQIHGTV